MWILHHAHLAAASEASRSSWRARMRSSRSCSRSVSAIMMSRCFSSSALYRGTCMTMLHGVTGERL